MAKFKTRSGPGIRKSSPIDLHVGTRVRQRRVLLGMTQTMLADTMGMSFQQVQKYEWGTNRISASRLFEMSQMFDVPVEHFFDDMPPEVVASSPAVKKRGKAKKLPSCEPELMGAQETMRLVRSYYKIEDADVRKQVYEMTKALGADAGKGS